MRKCLFWSTRARSADTMSERGNAIQIPQMPKRAEKSTTKGMSKKNCLLVQSKREDRLLPMLWKYEHPRLWMPTKIVVESTKRKGIRAYEATAASLVKSESRSCAKICKSSMIIKAEHI